MHSTTSVFERIMNKKGAVIAEMASGNVVPVYPNADRRKRPIAWLKRGTFKSYVADGIFIRSGDYYIIADSYLRRRKKGIQSFANQHFDKVEADIYHPDGIKRPTVINKRQTALARLARMRNSDGSLFLSKDEVEAGERFAQDYGRAGMASTNTQRYDAPGIDRDLSTNTAEDIAIMSIDARQRSVDALRYVGAGLDRAIISVCGHNHAIGALERSEGWAQRSGKTVVKIALARLSEFYGCKPGEPAGEH